MSPSFLVSLSYFLAASAVLFIQADADEINNNVIQWIRSKGGLFSDKLEIRRMNITDTSSPFGVFATQDISSKERIIEVPHECYIQLGDDALEMDTDDDSGFENFKINMCMLATKLMQEMKLDQESEFAPYITYLKTQKSGQLPAAWSKAGKDLLRKIMPAGHPMVDWLDEYHKENGLSCTIKNEPFHRHMMEMTQQRAFDVALIPIWDMVNHDNGRINTENDSIYNEGGVKIRASQDISAGEEIFASYDLCHDCLGIDEVWGTPEILKDFGFVENYPHRWVFPEENIWFQVEEDDDGEDVEEDDGEDDEEDLIVFWDHEHYKDDFEKGSLDDEKYFYGVPSQDGITFLKDEYERLLQIAENGMLSSQGDIPDNEWGSILKYYNSATTDIAIAISFAEEEHKFNSDKDEL